MRAGVGLVLALALAACNKAETPTAPSPSNEVVYTVLAASDGSGVGGSAPCVPFDSECPNGTGYVYLLKRRLQSSGRTVSLRNLAVLGAVMSPAIQALSRDIGRDVFSTLFDQATVVSTSSTHITIFTAGNDAHVIAQNIRAGRGAADVRGFIDQHVQQWGTDLQDLVRRVRARAPEARIVAINLPNLGAAPYVAGSPVLERSILQRIAVGLTDRVNTLASQNVLVIDLMCDPRIYDASSFSADGFHPSDRGYGFMAELTYPALANGTTPPPSSSCPQRALLPVF